MSFQAGIFYFDGRPVPQCEAAAVLEWIGSCDKATALHRQNGVFLAPCSREYSLQQAITFDGRLDNREDLLPPLGSILPAEASDAAVALAAYEKWGTDGLAHLVGDWSLAIWDGPRKTVVLASDFAGVRPLYYAVQQERVVWSTRLQPLSDWLGDGDIDEAYAGGFLLSAACADRTPYRGICSPPPGHAVSIGAKGTKIQQFWKLPDGETIRYSQPSQYEEELVSLFADAVRCRLRTGGPVLAELSGGLDSSSIVCMANHLIRNGSIQNAGFVTLTVEHQGSIDTPFYTAVEQSCGFESVHVQAADHPFATETDTGGATPAFGQRLNNHISDLARRSGAKTYLTGRLGDLVMGNSWDDSEQVAGLLRHGRIGEALRQSLAWSKVLRIPIWWVLGRAIVSNLPPAMALSPARPFTDGSNNPRMEDSIAPGFRKRIASRTAPSSFGEAWKQAPPGRRKYYRGLLETLALRKLQPPEPLEHLHYTHPYAHRPLVAFLSSIPGDIVCGPGEPRRLMRKAFQSLWPPELRKRRSKDAFGGVYLEALRPLARMLLQETRPFEVVERGWVESKSLKKRLERMQHSLDCNESQLRNIILMELWLRGRDHQLRWKNLSLPA